MLVLKYVKQDEARFISHIDMLRHTSRILRRAHIPVKFSQGFNPHALVFFSPPSQVGVSSTAEYLAVDADISAAEALEKYNAATPSSIRAQKVYVCLKNPNLQGIAAAADFVFDTPYKQLDLSGGFEIEYTKKGEIVREEVSSKIIAVFDAGGKLAMRLCCGNSVLRPDRILPALNKMLGTNLAVTDIQKVALYVKNAEGNVVLADEYLSSISIGEEVDK